VHLIASIGGGRCVPDVAAPKSTAHLTPTATGWLVSLIVPVDDQRLVAALVVQHDCEPISELALLQRIDGLACRASRETDMAEPVSAHLRCAAEAFHSSMRPAARRVRLSTRQLRLAMDLLGSDLQSCLPIGVVARACGLSESHLRRGFRTCTGQSPGQWRLEQRLRLCRRELLETDLPLAQIARQAGFTAQNYFSRVFMRSSGVTPQEWRRIFRGIAKTSAASLDIPSNGPASGVTHGGNSGITR
jgi:AraC-like DNA-binding protein